MYREIFKLNGMHWSGQIISHKLFNQPRLHTYPSQHRERMKFWAALDKQDRYRRREYRVAHNKLEEHAVASVHFLHWHEVRSE